MPIFQESELSKEEAQAQEAAYANMTRELGTEVSSLFFGRVVLKSNDVCYSEEVFRMVNLRISLLLFQLSKIDMALKNLKTKAIAKCRFVKESLDE